MMLGWNISVNRPMEKGEMPETAEQLSPHFVNGVPEAHSTWSCEVSDILLDGWEGKTVIDQTAIAACRPDEWLLVVAWDESQKASH